MRWIIILFLFANNLLGQFTYSGYLYNADGSGANNVAVKLFKSTAGATTKTGTLTKITSGIFVDDALTFRPVTPHFPAFNIAL